MPAGRGAVGRADVERGGVGERGDHFLQCGVDEVDGHGQVREGAVAAIFGAETDQDGVARQDLFGSNGERAGQAAPRFVDGLLLAILGSRDF